MYRFNQSLLGTLEVAGEYLNTTNVSVQLQESAKASASNSPFKYNKCIGSIIFDIQMQWRGVGFKYNKCIGSISYNVEQYAIRLRFKYNKCIGSMECG